MAKNETSCQYKKSIISARIKVKVKPEIDWLNKIFHIPLKQSAFWSHLIFKLTIINDKKQPSQFDNLTMLFWKWSAIDKDSCQ